MVWWLNMQMKRIISSGPLWYFSFLTNGAANKGKTRAQLFHWGACRGPKKNQKTTPAGFGTALRQCLSLSLSLLPSKPKAEERWKISPPRPPPPPLPGCRRQYLALLHLSSPDISRPRSHLARYCTVRWSRPQSRARPPNRVEASHAISSHVLPPFFLGSGRVVWGWLVGPGIFPCYLVLLTSRGPTANQETSGGAGGVSVTDLPNILAGGWGGGVVSEESLAPVGCSKKSFANSRAGFGGGANVEKFWASPSPRRAGISYPNFNGEIDGRRVVNKTIRRLLTRSSGHFVLQRVDPMKGRGRPVHPRLSVPGT